MNNKEEIRNKIETDEDFIHCPRLGNSLAKLKEVHPNGIDDERIGKVLLLSEDSVKGIFRQILGKIREALHIKGV